MNFILRWLISLLFQFQAFVVMAVFGIIFAPYALIARRGAIVACRLYCIWVLWTARWILGIQSEIRGNIPTDEVIIAAKHQSFLDILMIFYAVPRAKFIMKRELLWTPFIGLYAKRLGCIPVNRGKKGAAIAKMIQDVAHEFSEPGQLVIYPQGTRVTPKAYKPYKVGISILYEELGQPCVPVATNAGLFWPKNKIQMHPGLAIVEFLDPIAPNLLRKDFMSQLEHVVETRSNALVDETETPQTRYHLGD